jgi:hypothetical protein
LTSLTLDEFRRWVPPFETAFQAHMAHWRLDGPPRTARPYTTDMNCPLPSPEERLLFLLVDWKTSPLQVVQGRLFGMGQRQAHQGIHGLVVVLRAARRALGAVPPRSVTALAQRLGGAEADAAPMVVPPAAPAPAPTLPLLGTRGRHGVSSAPRLRLSKRAVIAASTSATRSNTSC